METELWETRASLDRGRREEKETWSRKLRMQKWPACTMELGWESTLNRQFSEDGWGRKKKETPGKGRANRTQILLEGGVWAGGMPDGSSPRGRHGSKQLTTTTSVHCFKGRKRAKWETWGKPTFSCTYIFAHVSASTCRERRGSYIAQAVSPHCAHDELIFFPVILACLCTLRTLRILQRPS